MPIRIGDTVFLANGKPAVVTGKTVDRKDIETTGQTLEQTRRRGFINGLSEAERGQFNEIIDRVRGESQPVERVRQLSEIIGEMKGDPTKVSLVRYLEGELKHTMISYGIRQRSFNVSDLDI